MLLRVRDLAGPQLLSPLTRRQSHLAVSTSFAFRIRLGCAWNLIAARRNPLRHEHERLRGRIDSRPERDRDLVGVLRRVVLLFVGLAILSPLMWLMGSSTGPS